MVLLHERKPGFCDICGGPCFGITIGSHPVTYPFLPGGYEVRRPDMPDSVYVTARIFDEDGNLVATPGDTISGEDAKQWKVGADGTQSGGEESVAPEPEPEGADKSPQTRTRAGRQGENR